MKSFTKKQLRELKSATDNKLTKKVINSILNQGDAEECNSYFQDVLNYGCGGGNVGELIYYTDTIKWYNKYRQEINQLIKEMRFDLDMTVDQLNGFDDDDMMCLEQHNQNLLAWFSYEQTCYNLANELELDY
jgi:hypothetical protein